MNASAGQSTLEPVQDSATSHVPAAARQIVPGASSTSLGHAALDPVQLSAESQGPAAGRQTVPPAMTASAGQVVLEPVQVSCASQGPAAGRQTVVAGAGVYMQPVAGMHASIVHRLPSSQLSGTPAWQIPALQVSVPLHRFPSGHGVPSAGGVPGLP